MDAQANLALGTVLTAPSPATSGTSLTLSTGHGARFPAAPFNATAWPVGVMPDPSNAEIVRVTVIAGDVLTIVRAQESTAAKAIGVGYYVAATITKKTFTDLQTLIPVSNPWVFKPEAYGAVADLVTLRDVVATSGSAAITSASGGFANLATGMKAVIACGASNGTTPQYVTLTKVSSTQATMSANAAASGTFLAMFGTDNTTALRNCQAAAIAYAQAGDGYAQIYLSGLYGVASAPIVGGATAGNAYIPLPVLATTDRKVTLEYQGKGTAQALAHWQQTAVQAVGSGLACLNGAGSVDSTYGPTSLIGGPVGGYGASTNAFTNMCVVLNGITAVVPYNGTCSGFDFYGVAECIVEDASCFGMAVVPGGGPLPVLTSPQNAFSNFGYFGLRMPSVGNNALCIVKQFSVEGMVNGVRVSEHTIATSLRIIYCFASIVPYCGGGNDMADRITILHATVEVTNDVIATIETTHVIFMEIDHLETEVFYNSVVNDAGGLMAGYVKWADYNAAYNNTQFIIGANFSPYNLHQRAGALASPAIPASTVSLKNPFGRDCAVSIAGGTVTAVKIDGTTVVVSTPSMVILPTGRTISLTYSVVPTSWTWVAL